MYQVKEYCDNSSLILDDSPFTEKYLNYYYYYYDASVLGFTKIDVKKVNKECFPSWKW